jgi:hypothetical protein
MAGLFCRYYLKVLLGLHGKEQEAQPQSTYYKWREYICLPPSGSAHIQCVEEQTLRFRLAVVTAACTTCKCRCSSLPGARADCTRPFLFLNVNQRQPPHRTPSYTCWSVLCAVPVSVPEQEPRPVACSL